MPRVSTEEIVQASEKRLTDLILEMKSSLILSIEQIKTDITNINEKVSVVEEKILGHDFKFDSVKLQVEAMQNKIHSLERQITLKEIHDRKSNLQFYGILEGKDENVENTLKTFFIETLKLTPSRVDQIYFKTVHRMPLSEYQKKNKPDAPRSIMASFLSMEDRDEIYTERKHTFTTGKSIQTDIPPLLKKRRAVLGRQATLIRRDQKLWARVRLDMADLKMVLETRDPSIPSSPWSKCPD
jgi:hypothetical protein